MQINLQIADHFDLLANGKVLAVGLFPDRVVVMQVPAEAPEPSAELPYATDLGLLLTLSDAPAAPLEGEVRILSPGDGRAVGVLPFGGLNISGGQSANILSKLRPLMVQQAGVFTVEAQVGDETARASFEVRIIRLPSSVPSSVQSQPASGTGSAAPAKPRRARRVKAPSPG